MKGRLRFFKTKKYLNSFLFHFNIGTIPTPIKLFVVSLTPEEFLLFSIPTELASSTSCWIERSVLAIHRLPELIILLCTGQEELLKRYYEHVKKVISSVEVVGLREFVVYICILGKQ